MANRSSSDGVRVNESAPVSEAAPVTPEDVVSNVAEPVQVELKTPGAASRLRTFAAGEPVKTKVTPTQTMRRSAPAAGWQRVRLPIAVGLAVVALVEAVVIAAMFVKQPDPASTTVTASPAAAAATDPLPVGGGSLNEGIARPVEDQNRPSAPDPASDSERRNADDAIAAAIAKAASNQRSGGVRLTSPIELKVLQGDRVLGSSADGPIVTTAGTHQLDFINTSLGFRARRAVTFRAGEITSLSIDVPSGSISVNAEPWAEVWIDNRPIGETPLAHLQIPIGEHEIVFRHPDLGERRQQVVVRADGVTRASATFD